MESAGKGRVILLGASNLTRGFSTVLDTAWKLLGRPFEVAAAMGYGRSYGIRSSILGRSLPGIADCGLWEALGKRPGAPSWALLTDIGNDILYDVPLETILSWVELCLERLGEAGARTVVTLLPMERIERLSPFEYLVFRTVLFPSCRLPFSEVLARARALDLGLRDLAVRKGADSAELEPAWYGRDPIHILKRRGPVAWREILGKWRPGIPTAEISRGSLKRWLSLRLLRPERRWVLGFERNRRQPSRVLPDGTTISLY